MQLSLLPKLEWLILETPQYSASSMDGLSRLLSLTHLKFYQGGHLPSSLAAMTWLKHLKLCRLDSLLPPEGLNASLGQLQQLTSLMLHGAGVSQLPTSLADLSRLRQCMIWTGPVVAVHAAQQEQQPQQLPTGIWLSILQRLFAPWPILAQSTAMLAQAQQLEHLAIAGLPSSSHGANARQWGALWEWAAVHPPLEILSIDVEEEPNPSEFNGPAFDEVLQLLRRRPSLSVFRAGSDTGHPSFYTEYEF